MTESKRASMRSFDVIQRARSSYEEGRVANDLLQGSVARSWQRCLGYGLHPGQRVTTPVLSGNELREYQEAREQLIRYVEPLVWRLAKEFPDCQVLLVGEDCNIVRSYGATHTLEGNSALAAGTSIAEQYIGTNAPAIVTAEHRPSLVTSGEHLLLGENHLSCAAAPLHDPSGGFLGSIDVTRQGPMNEGLLHRVTRVCDEIEKRWLLNEHQTHWIMQLTPVVGSPGIHAGYLAIDQGGTVVAVDRSSLELLGASKQEVLGIAAAELFNYAWEDLMRLGQQPEALLSVESPHLEFCARLSQPDTMRRRVYLQTPGARMSNQKLEDTGQVLSWPEDVLDDLDRARRALQARLPVLIKGESGSGKEVLAKTLHQWCSPDGPWVAVNCAALPEGLIESELFGHREGAFTGSRKGGYSGRLLQANKGTILLDEIGDMPIELQARLLRVLQERRVSPLGDEREIPFSANVIAASNRDLEDLVCKGTFREDLYYRLAGVVIELPRLAEREDLGEIISHHWDQLCERHGRDVILASDLLQALSAYSWPGNWRELDHCLEATLVGLPLHVASASLAHVPSFWQRRLFSDSRQGSPLGSVRAAPPRTAVTRENSLQTMEWQAMEQAIAEHDGNVTAAARSLGISRSTLYRWIKKRCGRT